MRNIIRRTSAALSGVVVMFSAGMALANPTVGILINNNWSTPAVNSPRDCLAVVTPAFDGVPANTASPAHSAAGSFANSFVCDVQYAKNSSSSTYCRFRIARTQSFVGGTLIWNAPSVIVTRGGSGINCTFTLAGNRPEGGFDATLNLNN